ncbi:hypothetical protein TNCV_5076661 [Trichonephila clavipes]|uniref:Uncharacterized protein n=1 Tax=Trichonephila clavipes TaxID=2585209 RepID=A0A8X6RUA8_TRICX|nr:hypothetical protein TNCV_5076661 [Trichonephila clavipes]
MVFCWDNRFKSTAEELDLILKSEFKVVHLDKLITVSRGCDKEFTRELLGASKEEWEMKIKRKQREREKEEWGRESRKEEWV